MLYVTVCPNKASHFIALIQESISAYKDITWNGSIHNTVFKGWNGGDIPLVSKMTECVPLSMSAPRCQPILTFSQRQQLARIVEPLTKNGHSLHSLHSFETVCLTSATTVVIKSSNVMLGSREHSRSNLD